MRKVHATLSLIVIFLLGACSNAADNAGISPLPTHTIVLPSPTLTPQPTFTPSPLPPTPTPEPTTAVEATVWTEDPFAPILTYHQFAANHAKKSTGLKVRFEDFEIQLNQLYDAGFSLISLEDWMAGNLVVPAGRRPLVFSMDDLYFNNQLRLDENGDPLPETGLGILWSFYQQHPDFGYSGALFVNLGDKLYANPDDPTWELQLAEAIAWGIDHEMIPYNHFYTHPLLDKCNGQTILWEAEMNDVYLRELLRMAGRTDLIPRLGNIIALTYGIWPKGNDANTMLSYVNPEGMPVQAVMEIDSAYLDKYMPAPYDPNYDVLHLQRQVGSPEGVDFIVSNAEKFPTAQTCSLGNIPETKLEDGAFMMEQILAASQQGCPDGVYVVRGMLFRLEAGQVNPIELPTANQ